MGKVQEHKRAAKAKRQEGFRRDDQNTHSDLIEVEGVVNECLPNTMFRITITQAVAPQLVGQQLLGTLAGKMRLFRIRVLPGDGVRGYVSKYDLKKVKITYRSSQRQSQ